MQICLIRHGETDWNAARRIQGREDIPLNPNGISQAERCGLALKYKEWGAVFSSPLCRARKTADIIADKLNIETVLEDNDLTERDFGNASGLTYGERMFAIPNKYEGIEDFVSLQDRVYSAICRIADAYLPEDIIVVSHGGAINALFAKISDQAIGTGKTSLENACINLLEYEKQRLSIVYYNKSAGEITKNQNEAIWVK